MDRIIVYPGAAPLDTDVLNCERNVMVALGFLAQMAIGTNTIIDGLACTQAAVPNMTVVVAPGSILAMNVIDTLAFGSLAADTSDALMKMGINITSTSFSMTAPGTAGFSQNYLIEAELLETDGNSVVLPYYNAANPALPYSGPANDGAAQNTTRRCSVGLQVKAGTPAATGTQTTPSVDSGWVGIYVVTVAYGQSSILNANINLYPGAPFIQTKLQNVRQRLSGNINLYVATTGSDSTGSGSALYPWATMQKAWNYIISSLDLNGYNVTVNVANGTYSQGLIATGVPIGLVGGVPNSTSQILPQINFVGNVGSPGSVIINATNSNGFYVGNGASISVSGFQVSATGSVSYYNLIGCGICAFGSASVMFGYMVFGSCTSADIRADQGSLVESRGQPYSIVGNSLCHMYAAFSGYATNASSAVTLSGTPSFSGSFAIAVNAGVIFSPYNSTTYSGSATGQYYNSTANGVIETGGGATFFPGNSAGGTSLGGQYY